MHDLAPFIEAARKACQKIQELIVVSETSAARPPAELTRNLKFLSARTRHAEIRVLILGPLKSGKSTLMNVLTENPYVSQISPLPAYPCFVEVRDLERDAEGRAVEEPKSLFYKQGSDEPEALTLERGLTRLGVLLEEFMRGRGEPEIEYERVVQKVNLPPGENGLSLILIDSPGLFFSKKVDTTFFNKEASRVGSEPASDYSIAAGKLYWEADVAIFVIRPEQLFFHIVSDWLGAFIKDELMRVFILVNASTHSKTQTGNLVEDYDQVKKRGDVEDYFLTHVADDALIARIQKGDNISLHFADLLDAATAIFQTRETSEFYETDSGRAVRALKEYISSDLLAEKKKRSIQRLAEKTALAAQDFLRQIGKQKDDEMAEVDNQLDETCETLNTAQKDLARLSDQKKEAEKHIIRLDTRLKVMLDFLRSGKLPDQSVDPALKELARLKNTPLETGHSVEAGIHSSDADAKKLIGKIYDKWLGAQYGGYGDITLRRLARSVWEEKVERDDLSLRSRYKEEVRRRYEAFIRQARASVDEQDLLDILNDVSASEADVKDENPVFQNQSIPLLDFKTRKWGGSITSLFRITPKALWGENGDSVIKDEAEKDILREEKDSFITKIWGNPWNLKDYFSPQHIELKARILCLRKAAKLWAERLPAQVIDAKTLHARLAAEIAEKQGAAQAAQNTKAQLEEKRAVLKDQGEDMRNRCRQIDRAIGDIKLA